jgi:hypothetical protein
MPFMDGHELLYQSKAALQAFKKLPAFEGIVAGIKADDFRAALNLARDAVPLHVLPLACLK